MVCMDGLESGGHGTWHINMCSSVCICIGGLTNLQIYFMDADDKHRLSPFVQALGDTTLMCTGAAYLALHIFFGCMLQMDRCLCVTKKWTYRWSSATAKPIGMSHSAAVSACGCKVWVSAMRSTLPVCGWS